MQHLLLFAGLAALGSAVKFHAPLNSLVQVGEGYVRFNVTGHPHLGSPSGAHKRDTEVELTPQQAGTAYTIQLSLGTPAQSVVVQLDTGSSDLWVNPNCSNNNGADQISYCNGFPRFDSAQSSTLVNSGSSFNLAYGLGTATVQYVQDTVQAGSKQHIPHALLFARTGSGRRSNTACWDTWHGIREGPQEIKLTRSLSQRPRSRTRCSVLRAPARTFLSVSSVSVLTWLVTPSTPS